MRFLELEEIKLYNHLKKVKMALREHSNLLRPAVSNQGRKFYNTDTCNQGSLTKWGWFSTVDLLVLFRLDQCIFNSKSCLHFLQNKLL